MDVKPSQMKIVISGAPCSGKTTLAQLIQRAYPQGVVALPEAASLLFSGGFPRFSQHESRIATQRAIFHVQRELEATFAQEFPDRTLVLDRATVDGAAYWPHGEDDFFQKMGTSLQAELARYDRVYFLGLPEESEYIRHRRNNRNRTEEWSEAKRLNDATRLLWEKHPNVSFLEPESTFQIKVDKVLQSVAQDLYQKQIETRFSTIGSIVRDAGFLRSEECLY